MYEFECLTKDQKNVKMASCDPDLPECYPDPCSPDPCYPDYCPPYPDVFTK